MEGIFICAAPHCLKSFLRRTEFESHIHESHADLLQPNAEKEDNNESEVQIAKQATSDSTARAPLRPVFSPGSNSQLHDREDKARRQQIREQSLPRPSIQPKPPQGFGQVQNSPSESQLDSRSQGFERPGPHNLSQQQNFDSLGTPKQESGQYSDKQQGILSDSPFGEYPPMHSIQPPNYMMPVNSNQMMNPPIPFGYAPFPVDGPQPYYGAPFEIARQDSAQEVGSEQGSLLGFRPGSAGNMNFPGNYPQPWNAGQASVPFEPQQGSQGVQDGFTNTSDSQGKVLFYQGEFGRNPGGLAINTPPPSANKPMDPSPVGNAMDPRDGKGILAPQPMPLPPPPPLPPHLSQHKRKYHSGDIGRDGQGFGWQYENRENFGTGQD